MAEPMMTFDIEADEALRFLKAHADRVKDVSGGFREFHQYMIVQVDSMFPKLRKGGTHRGVTWPKFADQYTRKGGRDGKGDKSTIKAWGGVPKVRGGGMVKGRRRPSDKRVTSQSALLQNLGNLRAKAATGVRRVRKDLLQFGTNVEYAAAQSKLRPFLFFNLPKDLERCRQILANWIERGKK